MPSLTCLNQRLNDQVADFFGAVAHLAGVLAFHLGAGDDLNRLHDPCAGGGLAGVL